ncbi:MAG: MBL fold metallo-hydrolase [Bacteroidetes bacterium]|nr:MBL fold metallo-hydrolase [Bacteroidota bacterium]
MILQSIEAGPVDTMGYLLADEHSREAVIIDVPPDSREALLAHVRDHDLRVLSIILTHGHFDHVGDVRALSETLAVPVAVGKEDIPMVENPGSILPGLSVPVEGMTPQQSLQEGDVVHCGRLQLRVIHAPGHSPGHIALYEMREACLFAGDVLFHSSIGRSDLPGGDYETLMKSIVGKLLVLPDETVVYPGHGPSTTIGFERRHNPFILEYLEHF